MTETTLQTTIGREGTTSCAWCETVYDDVVELLEHVEALHLEPAEPDLHAAA